MADDKIYFVVESLLQKSLGTLAKNIQTVDLNGLVHLPVNLKARFLHILCQRGLVTDDNIKLLLNGRVRELRLNFCDVTDRGLHHLHLCPSLQVLDLNACHESRIGVTSAGIKFASRHCHQLRVVYLRRCVNVTDDAIVALCESCPQLQYLNVGGCPRLGDASLRSLAEQSRHLESVNFSKTSVTDEGVRAIALGACQATLKEVQMSGCRSVTDESVEVIVQFCPQVDILIFHGCPHITGLVGYLTGLLAVLNPYQTDICTSH